MKYVLLAIILISACISAQYKTVSFSNVNIIAEVPLDYQKGLMNREYLEENKGMIFYFKKDQNLSFWMKNTKIPLDIIFVSSNLTIVSIQTMEPCTDYCKTYTSFGSYAIEVNKGFSAKYNISAGDKVIIS